MSSLFAPQGPWLFSRRDDLLAFGGSAALAFALLGVGAALGILESDAPDWIWIGCVLLVDVAHVWSTLYRVYLDPAEVRRRPWLYLGAPVICYGAGVIVHAYSGQLFWTVLAYIAVFHFVRQQAGWIALYSRRSPSSTIDLTLDRLAIYAFTLAPVVWWHANLPRNFHWFMDGDFALQLPSWLGVAALGVEWTMVAIWLVRQLWRTSRGDRPNPGTVLVIVTTWACWYVGIVALDGDFAFTVTNVLIHGIPYLWLTYRYGKRRAGTSVQRILRGGVPLFVLTLAVLAFAEEAAWDRLVWHERPWLFGEGRTLDLSAKSLLVPLLVLPQLVHYVLDGYVWKRRDNPQLG